MVYKQINQGAQLPRLPESPKVHAGPDFTGYAVGSTPRYWSDIAGVFEVVQRSDGKGQALRQTMERKGIEWRSVPFPMSLCGDIHWDDYTVSAEALVERSGFVSLFGRVVADDKFYELKVADSGDWELLAAKTKLKGGKVPFNAKDWHKLELAFREETVTAAIDGSQVVRINDKSFNHGNCGIGSGWHGAQFSNITIRSQHASKPTGNGQRAPKERHQ